MKIAFLSDSIYPYNIGGKEKRLFDLTTSLAKRGHEVHIYTMKFWRGEDVKKEKGVYLHGICKEYPLYDGKRRSIKQGIMFGLASFNLLKEDFDVIDADHMVYFHLFPAKLACLLDGKKLVVTWHEVWGKEYWISYMGKKGILGYIIEKITSKLPDKIITISNHTSKDLTKKLGVDKKKITIIECSINFKEINNIKPSKEQSDIIFAGRFLNHKNVDFIIRSVSLIKKTNPNLKCIIIGDGPEKENLLKLTKELNLEKNIIFKGFIESHDKVLSLIKSSKVFVLPSTREGFGIVVIEANACGIPVITIDHEDNASKDLIKNNQNGYVCKLDEKYLADNIIKAIKQSKSMKNNCISEAKQYDWGNFINKFEEVYKG